MNFLRFFKKNHPSTRTKTADITENSDFEESVITMKAINLAKAAAERRHSNKHYIIFCGFSISDSVQEEIRDSKMVISVLAQDTYKISW